MIMGGKINTCSKSSEKQQNGDICGKGTLYCINPPLLAEAIAQLHLNEKNVQDLVIKVQREGHIDALWPTSKPNDWTLRNTFLHVTENGMIRESIIPLLLNVSKKSDVMAKCYFFIQSTRHVFIQFNKIIFLPCLPCFKCWQE